MCCCTDAALDDFACREHQGSQSARHAGPELALLVPKLSSDLSIAQAQRDEQRSAAVVQRPMQSGSEGAQGVDKCASQQRAVC